MTLSRGRETAQWLADEMPVSGLFEAVSFFQTTEIKLLLNCYFALHFTFKSILSSSCWHSGQRQMNHSGIASLLKLTARG